MDARSFCVKHSGIELGALPSSGAINDHTAEITQTTDTFQYVLATQHFKNDVDALTVSQRL